MAIRERRPIPEPIRNAPELGPGLEFYLSAFWDLHTCRQIGFGVGPIAWTATQEYAKIVCESPEEINDFHYLIKGLDNKYLEWRESTTKG